MKGMENMTKDIAVSTEPNDNVSAFLQADREWLCQLVEKYPQQIPIQPIAEHWGCEAASVRAAIEQNTTFGLFWRKPGKTNRAYLIPTGVFVQWYCKVKF